MEKLPKRRLRETAPAARNRREPIAARLSGRDLKSRARWMAVLATTVLLGVLATPSTLQAQIPAQFLAFPTCVLPPAPPGTDTWPVAATDSLGSITSASVTFSGVTLLANDTGTSLTLVAVGPTSSGGGTVTGTDPFTFTLAAGFIGADIFTYEIRDASGQTAIGLVKVTSGGDTIFPTVGITAPLAGDTVSGSVLVRASATDNIAIAGVRFFDGVTQIGPEVTAAPFQTTWDTTLAANGERSLTVVARDPAGNTSTSAIVAVTVSNLVPVAVPTIDKTVFSEGLGKRTTPAFSTTSPGEVLVAFAASDGPPAGDAQTLAISGGGLTWTRVQRAAAQFGVSEIWTATAPTALTNVTVASTQAAGGFHQSLTVIAFTGVGGIGASSVGGAVNGAPTVSLVTQAAGSVVYAVGNDWDRAAARAIPAGQTKVHEFVDTAVGDTFWVQAANGTIAAAGTSVTLNATDPINDQWNFAIVELTSGGAAPPPPPPPPPSPTPAGPVLALSFNEASGAAANDSSGNANNGTIAGATRVAGQPGFGGALSFDGVASIVNVAHSASLALTTGMTLEAWVNPSANAGVAPNAGWRTVILKERGADGLAYALYGNDGDMNPSRPAGYVHNGADGGTDKEATAAPALPIGVWSHVAVTFDSASIRLYVNGVLRNTLAAPGAIGASASPLRIGGNNVFSAPGTEFFAGLIDEVRVYNRALGAAEITTDMNTPIP
jgi:hypothetical protein